MKRLDESRATLAEFAQDLTFIRISAGLTLRDLAAKTHYSLATLCTAAKGQQLPTWRVTRAYLEGCGVPLPLIETEWNVRWKDLEFARGDMFATAQLTDGTPGYGLTGSIASITPGPEDIHDPAGLNLALKQFKVMAGHPSIDTWARRLGLSRSRVADAVSGRHVPQWDLILAVLLEAGASSEEVLRWGLAWQRAWDARRTVES